MSLFREWVEEQLPIAEASLKHCEELLAELRERVAERKQRGYPSRESEKLLKLLESSDELHLRRVENLRRDLVGIGSRTDSGDKDAKAYRADARQSSIDRHEFSHDSTPSS